MKKYTSLIILTAALVLASCGNNAAEQTDITSASAPVTTEASETASETTTEASVTEESVPREEWMIDLPLKPMDNVIRVNGSYDLVLHEGDYTDYNMRYYTFYDSTVFEGCEEEAAALLEAGKNPGLGIRGLHAEGIKGNVNVAIIDQNMILGNPELEDRIIEYKDFGTGESPDSGSLHGLSVTSILAGKTVGVAPEARVYYASVPGWAADAAYYGDALEWLIGINEALPNDDKIRVVSVSAGPETNYFDNSDRWSDAVAEAQAQGMMIIDCRGEQSTGYVFGSYHDRNDPDNIEKSYPGYPYGNDGRDFTNDFWKKYLFAPASERTIAHEMEKGERHFRFDGVGGQSWSVPYVAGVAAMGYQVNPDMTPEQCRELLFSTAWIDGYGLSYVNPPAFVEAARKLASES